MYISKANTTIFILASFLLSSCQRKSLEKDSQNGNLIFLSKDSTFNTSKAISVLFNSKSFDCEMVGYGAITSIQYKSYLWLVQYANYNDIYKLLKSNLAHPMTYGFKLLVNRNPAEAKKWLKENIKNSSPVNLYCGCEMINCQLNMTWLNEIRPNLSSDELKYFEQKIVKGKKQDNLCL